MTHVITLRVNMTPEAVNALEEFLKNTGFRQYKARTKTEEAAFYMTSARHALLSAIANQRPTGRVPTTTKAATQ